MLYLTTYDPARSDLGGASWVDRRLVEELATVHAVEVAQVLRPLPHAPAVPISVQDSRGAQARVLLRMALHGEAYLEAKYRFHPGWRFAAEYLSAVAAAREHDLIVTSQWPALLMAEEAGFVPDVHIAHNVDTVLAQRYDPAPLRLFRDARRLEDAERRLLGRARRVVTLSRSDGERLRQWGLDARHVVLGSSRLQEQAAQAPTTHRIGFIGSMQWPPNRSTFDELIGAVLPRVAELDPVLHARLTVVVAGRGSEDLTGPGVEALGVVDDVSSFYADVDLVVVPRTGPSTGISVKLLEAVEHGVAVIAPRALLSDAGLTNGAWAADSVEQMTERVIDFYEGRLNPGTPTDGTRDSPTILTLVRDLSGCAEPAQRGRAASGVQPTRRFIERMAELHALVRTGPRPLRIQTLNLQHLQLSSVNESFRAAIDGADRLTADGWPVQLLMRRRGVRVGRVTGSGFLREALDSSVFAGLDVALLGAKPHTGDRFAALLRESGGRLVFRDHGTAAEWDADDLAARIARAGARVVLVAVTSPTSELIAHQLRIRSSTTCIIGVGGAVDMVTGVRLQAPGWVTRFGLEWLFRFAQEPRRLFRRYFVEGISFLVRIATGRARLPDLQGPQAAPDPGAAQLPPHASPTATHTSSRTG